MNAVIERLVKSQATVVILILIPQDSQRLIEAVNKRLHGRNKTHLIFLGELSYDEPSELSVGSLSISFEFNEDANFTSYINNLQRVCSFMLHWNYATDRF